MRLQRRTPTRWARWLSICSTRTPRNSFGEGRPVTLSQTSPTRTSRISTRACKRCSTIFPQARNTERGSQPDTQEFSMKLSQQGMALFLSWWLVLGGVQDGYAQAPAQALQQGPQQLQQLVAPIALYPDGLVAQILAGASYPEQVVEAEQWLEKHKNLSGEKLAKEVNKQHWDNSVKALTQFPAVLANMNQNLAWTSELGDAYVNQQQAVTQAIQTMRQKAKQAGNLKTTPQENVTTQGQTIVIQPAAPDVVYVPQYDPWLVYGYPLAAFPGWYPYPGLFLG